MKPSISANEPLITVHDSIEAIDARHWNALGGTNMPFLRHEFLSALERQGCVGGDTGWDPRYLTLTDERGLVGAVPMFLKWHSYGEFVFDFAWAQAYTRHGERYYPKLAVTVPFTPATGPRLLMRPGSESESGRLVAGIEAELKPHSQSPAHAFLSAPELPSADAASADSLSSAHALFLDQPSRLAFERAGWLLRRDCQFHWTNRGYGSFDDYLGTFTAEKRKKARRERRRVIEGGVRFETLRGGEIGRNRLDQVYAFHRDTFLRHGHEPYLTRAFFDEIAKTLGDAWFVKLAMAGSEPVAAAIFFESGDTLYGRYWGSAADFHSLHFETCYHQGIEYCIERGLARFEPGTQGEHKVSRGFEPKLTWSAHFIADPRFRAAIADYLEREGIAVSQYADQVREHVPFRQPS